MKIYIGHAKKLDFKKELYQPIRESQLNVLHEIILPHEIHEEASDFVTRDIIKMCDVVIAEVSFPTTGLGIELGWADSASVPIICIYKKGQEIAGSLKVITDNFIEYDDVGDMINKISDAIEKIYK